MSLMSTIGEPKAERTNRTRVHGVLVDMLYMILSGQADVVREEPDGSPSTRAVLGPGHFFGEEGLAYH